ncbi:MAG: hypothetical protein GY845_25925 [Planctomycetes bacterium]|nr:hypothetical protein [Planctomycetota bacterium]
MKIDYKKITYKWRTRSGYSLDKLASVLQGWLGTPYREGQAVKGVGVDCVRFGVSVACEMANIDMIDVPRDAPLTSTFSPKKAFATVKKIRDQLPMYKQAEIKRITVIYPGDLIIARRGEGPGHILVVGTKPHSLYHAINGSGVAKTGTSAIGQIEFIWRMQWP